MTKSLEEEFGLPSAQEDSSQESSDISDYSTIEEYKNALSICDKIDNALKEVKGMEVHDKEMDEIALDAQEAFKQLMTLGYNMTDMAAGPVFSNAAHMLEIALKAKDSKTNKKLKQIELMLKKANLDARQQKDSGSSESDDGTVESRPLDRNELLKILHGSSGEN